MAGIAQNEESMGLFTVEELREVISVKVLTGKDSLSGKRRIRQISTDSRSIRRGDLFVALRGDRYDGHEFVPAILAQGAAGAIVHDEYRLPPSSAAVRRIEGRSAPFLLGVRDPLFAYQQLATHHRSRFHIPVVAVTEERQDDDKRNGSGGAGSAVAGVKDRREFQQSDRCALYPVSALGSPSSGGHRDGSGSARANDQTL